MADPSSMFSEIEEFLLNGKYPEKLKGKPGQKSNFRRKASLFSLMDGTLYRRHGPARSLRKVIVDDKQQREILQRCHEGNRGNTLESNARICHFGQDKTENEILGSFWWPGIRDGVRNFVKTCEKCSCTKGAPRLIKTEPGLHPVPLPTDPWKQIGVDLCSMPMSTEGFTCMIVVIDHYTKWMEAEQLPDKLASTVADCLFRLICRHGCADIQINDQSGEFVNEISSHLHNLAGVQQRISIAYRPQTDGLTEINNRSIQMSLVTFLTNPDGDQAPEDWPHALPRALFAFRTCKQASTGHTPFYLMYGRRPCLPEDLIHRKADVTSTAIPGVQGQYLIDESSPDEINKRLEATPYTRI